MPDVPTEAYEAAAGGKICPDCHVRKYDVHLGGCDVARCLVTGLQRLTCPGGHDCGEDDWTGEWPGKRECAEFGVDLNTLTGSGRFVWNAEEERWRAAPDGLLRDRLIAARIVAHTFVADDGYTSVAVHSEAEAAERALAVIQPELDAAFSRGVAEGRRQAAEAIRASVVTGMEAPRFMRGGRALKATDFRDWAARLAEGKEDDGG